MGKTKKPITLEKKEREEMFKIDVSIFCSSVVKKVPGITNKK